MPCLYVLCPSLNLCGKIELFSYPYIEVFLYFALNCGTMELYLTDRTEWRRWLKEHHLIVNEVWLVYYKKPSGKPRIPYPDAVEEALCFGWIDGKIKKINEDYYIQRFTPRRPRSRWSKYNIDRVEKLMEKGLMKPEGMKAYQWLLDNPKLVYDNRSDGDPGIPADLLEALQNNELANSNFNKFTPSGRRIYISWLNSSKKQETRIRRIEKIVQLSVKNQPPGIM
jgi:uncharacterized protein YdeI (YjbR/CyaY-like superfamily)